MGVEEEVDVEVEVEEEVEVVEEVVEEERQITLLSSIRTISKFSFRDWIAPSGP